MYSNKLPLSERLSPNTTTFSTGAAIEVIVKRIERAAINFFIVSFKDNNSFSTGLKEFIKTDKDAAATALKSCIEHANGHNGTIAVADSSAGVLTLTQTNPGSQGDTTITEGLSNCTVTNFSGGTHEGGVNTSQDVGTLETKYTSRFDDPRYYSGDATG